jgi:hypothetical protein
MGGFPSTTWERGEFEQADPKNKKTKNHFLFFISFMFSCWNSSPPTGPKPSSFPPQPG